jgi:hypothetical protein
MQVFKKVLGLPKEAIMPVGKADEIPGSRKRLASKPYHHLLIRLKHHLIKIHGITVGHPG